jgi:hypothetical protein
MQEKQLDSDYKILNNKKGCLLFADNPFCYKELLFMW